MSNSSDADDALSLIRVEGGSPTSEEAAAAIAVVAGMLREGGAVEETPKPNAWRTATRAPREIGDRGHATWSDPTA